MATNKRYYWIKLKEEFFTDKRIKRLRRISGGDTYTIIYLKLLLLSLKDEGKLYYDGVESDFIKELALTIDETDDDVMVTVNYLINQGLLEVVTENDEYYLTEIPNLIGSETAWAEKKRRYRQNKQRTLSLMSPTHVRQEIAIEKDIEIEKDSSAKSTTTKRKRFEKPTLSQIEQYCIERNNTVNAEQFFDYYESNGWKVGKNSMKDWKAAVRTWERSEYRKPNSKKNSKEDAINVVKELMEEYANEQFEDNNGAIDVTDSVVY